MSSNEQNNRDAFGSKFGIIAAAAGSAIGLGNIWKFPYMAGQNGGGAFLFVYLFFTLAIGIPVMLSEFGIGRRGQRNVFGSFKKLSPGTPWYLVGIMGVAAAFMILAFYSAVAGWTLEYIYKSITDSFAGKTPNELEVMFSEFTKGSWRPVFWQLVFMFLTAWIIIAGVKGGIERYTKILMPLLFVIIIILCIRSLTLPNSMEGLKFIFKPDFSKLTGKAVLDALGQAFFSLSLGMGTLITYGSYIRKRDDLAATALEVSIADVLIAVLAGVAIFPAVFSFGINPAEGPGLVFITLPNIFEQMPGGYFFALIFFILLAVAALTSSISLLEVVVAYFSEELRMSRLKATIIGAVSIFVLGIFCSLSLGIMSDFQIFGKNFFDLLDFTSSNLLLPLGGFCIVMFVGWYMTKKDIEDELTNSGKLRAIYFPVYLFLIRFVAPIAIAIVFIYGLGFLRP
jgi:neurotransmitter:Na+ symporter, NSS family